MADSKGAIVIAFAQTLTPIAGEASGYGLWIFAGVILALIAGYIFWWRPKHLEQAKAIEARAGDDAKALEAKLLAELGRLKTAIGSELADLHHKVDAALHKPDPPPPPTPGA